jgi:predicted ester cyclase
MIARRTLLTRLGVTALGGAAACAGARTSTKGASNMAPTEDTRAAARHFYDVLTRGLQSGDLSSLAEVVAEDAVDHNPVPGMKPGREGIAASFAEFRKTFGDAVFALEDVIADGDKVACRLRVRATHRGTLMGVAPTGRQLGWTVIDLLRFSGGLMVERWGLADEMGILRQLDAAPG